MLIKVHHNDLTNRSINNAEVCNLVLARPQLKKTCIKRELRYLKSLLGEKHNTVITNTILVINAKTCAKNVIKLSN